jgi:4-diphosphocytidyl-2-C-methyl-D-erythritol kinase
VIAFAPCKINIGLSILGKRPDQYHDISTVFYPVPFYDVVEIVPAEQFHFEMSGLQVEGSSHTNLCVRAYELMREAFHLPPVSMYLLKHIPAGSGTGGGSSDAASVLQLLNQVFNLQQSTAQLTALANQLGSDCAFFLHQQPMLGSGRGNQLTPFQLSLTHKKLLLLFPPVHVSTAWAYANLPESRQPLDLEKLQLPIQEWRNHVYNDFEEPVFAAHPAIGSLKKELYEAGALYASLSGSGAAVYGIFDSAFNVTNLSSSMRAKGVHAVETLLS